MITAENLHVYYNDDDDIIIVTEVKHGKESSNANYSLE